MRQVQEIWQLTLKKNISQFFLNWSFEKMELRKLKMEEACLSFIVCDLARQEVSILKLRYQEGCLLWKFVYTE